MLIAITVGEWPAIGLFALPLFCLLFWFYFRGRYTWWRLGVSLIPALLLAAVMSEEAVLRHGVGPISVVFVLWVLASAAFLISGSVKEWKGDKKGSPFSLIGLIMLAMPCTVMLLLAIALSGADFD